MNTCPFSEVLTAAVEFAQRTRDKVPAKELLMLQGFMAAEFETLFHSQCWAFLIPDFVNVMDIAGQQVSLNEGTDEEMGDILAITTQNPHVSDFYRHIGWSEGNGVIWLDDPASSVWIEYQLPYPGKMFPDLAAMDAAAFGAALCPRPWKTILARRAAGELLFADDNAAAGGVQLGLAEKALVAAIQRFCPTPAWRGVRMSPPRRQRMGQPTYR